MFKESDSSCSFFLYIFWLYEDKICTISVSLFTQCFLFLALVELRMASHNMSAMNEVILSTAMQILGVRDHSSDEIRVKLIKKFPDHETEITQIITRLQEHKLLDDARFAAEYLHYVEHTSPKGILLLRQKLRQKGVTEDVIDEALTAIQPTQQALASSLVERKLRTLSSQLPRIKKKEKLYRFLTSKGFAFDVVRQAVEETISAELE